MLKMKAMRFEVGKRPGYVFGRRYASTNTRPREVPVLPDGSATTFRESAYDPASPALLPRGHFAANMPAIRKWFNNSTDAGAPPSLNLEYLSKFGTAIIPLELTHEGKFGRFEQPLNFFLNVASGAHQEPSHPPAHQPHRDLSATAKPSDTTRVYLAQASLTSLPKALCDDVPVPELVTSAGKGDIYASSLWLGLAPTDTPLHRDPNPNLFVQLAGKKIVRLFPPARGNIIFARIREQLGMQVQNSQIRGDEMMQGAEKSALDLAVWDDDAASEDLGSCWQASLNAGDGLFIPKGWWHSVRGVGTGMTGSVNWWFR